MVFPNLALPTNIIDDFVPNNYGFPIYVLPTNTVYNIDVTTNVGFLYRALMTNTIYDNDIPNNVSFPNSE